MPLRAGTSQRFENSLAEAIEHAFAGELIAQKGIPLPDQPKEDRRILFAAIAQGVVEYLRQHQSDFRVRLSGLPAGASATVEVRAPLLSVSPSAGTARASGSGFPAGQSVSLIWESTGAVGATTTVRSDGTFGPLNLTRPAGLPGGRQLVGARDNLGNAAVEPVSL